MRDGILVINAGSSSIKFSLYLSNGDGKPSLQSKGQVEGINVAPISSPKQRMAPFWPSNVGRRTAICTTRIC